MIEPPRTALLHVDPIACDGIGMCAHLAPGLVTLDSWGFPIVQDRLSGRANLRAAQAAAACPRICCRRYSLGCPDWSAVRWLRDVLARHDLGEQASPTLRR